MRSDQRLYKTKIQRKRDFEKTVQKLFIVRSTTTQRLTKAQQAGILRMCFSCCKKLVRVFILAKINVIEVYCVVVSSSIDNPTN
jgi:hypothetical protein